MKIINEETNIFIFGTLLIKFTVYSYKQSIFNQFYRREENN